MKQVFKMKNTGQEAKDRLNDHALTPAFHPTNFQVAQRLPSFDKASVAQANRLPIELLRHGTKSLVVNIGGIPVPRDDLPSRIHQPTQLDADDPATIRLAFLAHRLLTTCFTRRVQQFNAVAVDDGKQGRT